MLDYRLLLKAAELRPRHRGRPTANLAGERNDNKKEGWKTGRRGEGGGGSEMSFEENNSGGQLVRDPTWSTVQLKYHGEQRIS